MSGWQKSPTLTWHFHPCGPWMGLSACERVYRKPPPLLPEPLSILVCPRCVKRMRKIVERIESRDETPRMPTAVPRQTGMP